MSWHYQIMRHVTSGTDEDDWYGIHEYYVDSSIGWTRNPVMAIGDTPEEVIEVLEMMLSDAKKHGVKDAL